jgi:hypothetical protein
MPLPIKHVILDFPFLCIERGEKRRGRALAGFEKRGGSTIERNLKRVLNVWKAASNRRKESW